MGLRGDYCVEPEFTELLLCSASCKFYGKSHIRLFSNRCKLYRSINRQSNTMALGPWKWGYLVPAKSISNLFNPRNIQCETGRLQCIGQRLYCKKSIHHSIHKSNSKF